MTEYTRTYMVASGRPSRWVFDTPFPPRQGGSAEIAFYRLKRILGWDRCRFPRQIAPADNTRDVVSEVDQQGRALMLKRQRERNL